MGFVAIVLLHCLVQSGPANALEPSEFNNDQELASSILAALQDKYFEEEVLFDLKPENRPFVNRTISMVIKYVIKREVDSFRLRSTEAISRRVYSCLVMKLIDIAKDHPSKESNSARVDKAYQQYVILGLNSTDRHDEMADNQVFHYAARLYDILLKTPFIFMKLGDLRDLTPTLLLEILESIAVKPVQLAATLLVQFYLRSIINYAIESNTLQVLSTKPQSIGPSVLDVVKALATRLLPLSEMLDVHLSYSSPLFKDTCPSTWLGIVNQREQN